MPGAGNSNATNVGLATKDVYCHLGVFRIDPICRAPRATPPKSSAPKSLIKSRAKCRSDLSDNLLFRERRLSLFVGSMPNEPRRCLVQVWQPSNQRTLLDTAIACSISVSSLLASRGNVSLPLLIDVRRAPAFEADTTMLAGATWRDPFATDDWIKFLPHHSDIVVYCVHGHEISKNTCAALRAAGLKARYIEGGIEAWTAQSTPTIKKQSALSIPSPINAPSKWVAHERPKIDRIACPRLI